MLRSWQRRLPLHLEKKMYFEDVGNTLLIEAFADGSLDDEEFIILYDYVLPTR